jgi:hypothetical protein
MVRAKLPASCTPRGTEGANENETSIIAEPYGKLPAVDAGEEAAHEPHDFKNLDMNRIIIGLVIAIIVLLAAGIVFLGTYQRPPATAKMEVQIPNDRLSLQ